jgi:hypothetical protein
MATSKKLLSGKNDKNPGKIQPVDLAWSTANYANYSFGSPTGASPLAENYEEEMKDDEPAEEADDEKKVDVAEGEDMSDEKKDELAEGEDMPEDEKKEVSEEVHDEDMPEDEKKKEVSEEVHDEDMPEDEKKEVSEAVEDEDSDDDTLDIDIAELLDGEEEDVVELSPANADDVESEFVPDENDATWSDDDSAPMNVDVEDEDEPLKENEDKPEDDKPDFLKKKMDEADDMGEDEDEKKDELTEEDDEEKMDDADEKKEVSEGKLRLSFKTTEVSQLFENNNVLTEDDKRQSRVLFESAIRSVAKQLGSQLREAYQAQFVKAKSRHEAKVAKQLDSYMSYVVEQWSKDNKVALQNQMRNRLTDSFLAGFKKLCVEHYIEIPESKVNVVEALAKNVKSLKTKLQNAETLNVKLHEESQVAIARERAALKNEHKSRLIAEAASAVTAADRGEFTERAKTVTFTSTKEFKKDLIALREQYFAAKKAVSVERPSTEPVAMPIFEAKTETFKSSVDAYTKVADRLTRQS